MMIIYKVTNKINNKVYIGSTKRKFEIRISQHKNQALRGIGYRFHKAIKKHGFENFKFEIVSSVLDMKYMDEIEQWFIDFYDSTNYNKGYNAVGVLKGSRELISKVMLKDWKNPKQRKFRLEKMKEGSIKKSIIAVSIYDGSYIIYKSVHEAGRDGYSYSCIYPSLQDPNKTGQKNIWFYYDSNPEQYIQKAKDVLGEFKNEYYKPIIATNKLTGEQLHFSSTFTLKDQGFKAKFVRRVLRGEREGYAGYYWKYA